MAIGTPPQLMRPISSPAIMEYVWSAPMPP